jgi:pimeloyl-ACP methyl ester carboxylesterase
MPHYRPRLAGWRVHAHSRVKAIASRAFALTLLSVLTVACGGQHTRRDPNPVVLGPGHLVAIGAGRSLFLHCEGTGSPTVILEAGFGGNSNDWSEVEGPLGRRTLTCAYDRAGLGSSLPIPGVHDAAEEIGDLTRLLYDAHIPPPYVLVGHSYGGLLVRLFAHANPFDTAGIVLVDSMGRNQDRRLRAIWQAQPAQVRRQVPDPTAYPVQDGVDLLAGEALDARLGTLGDTPLVVITRGRLLDSAAQQLPPTMRAPVARLWETMQNELAALSSDRIHAIALRSGHFVQRSPDGQPDVVVDAVLAIIHAVRTRTHLPACPSVFHGASVQCRS